MADGGELAAAFRALAEEAAQAGEDIGDSAARWFEDTKERSSPRRRSSARAPIPRSRQGPSTGTP